MAADNTKILSAEQEAQLLQPIDEYVGGIQAKINDLRADGTDKVIEIQNSLDNLKRDRIYSQQEKTERAAQLNKELSKAKAVEEKNKGEIAKLIADAEGYLKEHFNTDYYQAVKASCREEKILAEETYCAAGAELNKAHQETVAKHTYSHEIKH